MSGVYSVRPLQFQNIKQLKPWFLKDRDPNKHKLLRNIYLKLGSDNLMAGPIHLSKFRAGTTITKLLSDKEE